MTLRTPAEQYAYQTRLLARGPRSYPSYLSFLGSGTPEGVVTAPPGSRYTDSDVDVRYLKETGTGNTGWAIG